MKKLPSARVLRRLIDYDPATGEMRWKQRPAWLFAPGKQTRAVKAMSYNTRHAGGLAFTAVGTHGYLTGQCLGHHLLAHRIIWALVHGQWPVQKIDHINGDKTDNRLCNLRAVDNVGNAQNMRRSKANRSGATGVYWSAQRDCWHAIIHTQGRTRHLGFHSSFDDAIAARKAAERKYGFHPNHGRAA